MRRARQPPRPLTADELRPSRRRRGDPTPPPVEPPRRPPPRRLSSEELRPSRRRTADLAAQAAGRGARVVSAAGRAALQAGWREAVNPPGSRPGPRRHPSSRTWDTRPTAHPTRSARRAPAAAPLRSAAGAAPRALRGVSDPRRRPPSLPAAPRPTLLRSPTERRQRKIERAASIPDLDTSHVAPARLRLLLVLCVVASVGILGRLVDLQVRQAPALAERARKQLVRTDRLPAQRGSIFDRSGRDLAISVQVPTIAADPRLVTDPGAEAQLLSTLLDVDAGVLRERLARPGAKFAYLARKVDEDTARRVAERAKDLPGVFSFLEPKRFLPADDLALPVLGKVGPEGEGLSGLEYQYRDVLAGKPGKLVTERDQQGREIPGGRIELDPSARGDDLVLTIDRSLQYETERRLAAQITATSAKGGIALVMDTTSGDLLSVANLETRETAGPPGGKPAVVVVPADKDQAVTNVYEPGSVAKLITVAGAIEDAKVRADQTLTVPNTIQVGDHAYTENEQHPAQAWSITDIVANSSNVGTIMIGQQLGKERFDAYLRAFGFGSRTGLGDPGESPGILADPAAYTSTSMGSFPIGQGIAVTAVQMLAAYNAVANGGTYVAPRLVKATLGPDGTQTPTPASEPRRVIGARTAAEMTKMLTEVVRVGTGTLAAVEGYTVAGKTGTARKPMVGQRGYEQGAYVSSFAGFAPAEQPQLTAMVILDQPTPIFGGLVAAPVFADLAGFALREMHIPPPAGGLEATIARAADRQSARGVGDLGDASAPATLRPPTSAPATTKGPTPAMVTTGTGVGTTAPTRSSTSTTVPVVVAAAAGP
ncbi:MAG: penicillin-binding protein 2, partial [Acidimicrobiales bacterium]